MFVTRQIASPDGLLDFTPELAGVFVEGADGLRYDAYFDGLQAFLAEPDVLAALAEAAQEAGVAGDGGMSALSIRAEKHGALYHPASVTAHFAGGEVKLCVNVAVTPAACAMLEQEAGLLDGLREGFSPEFLPCPRAFKQTGEMAFLLEDWFAGHHEFHQDGAGNVRLWDYDAGLRTLAQEQSLEIYRQAAAILTRYYHAASGSSIGPWHHAAGDFVANVTDRGVSVRLVTVRGYGAVRDFSEAGPLADKLAALAFCINMTMRMRLDRVEGVGELVLAGEDVAVAAVVGFVQGLAALELEAGTAQSILEFLASFSPEELARAAMGLAWPCPEDEAALLESAWPGHAAVVAEALGRFTG